MKLPGKTRDDTFQSVYIRRLEQIKEAALEVQRVFRDPYYRQFETDSGDVRFRELSEYEIDSLTALYRVLDAGGTGSNGA